MINLKNNKGAITLYILVSLLFFIIALVNVQAHLKSKEARVESEYQKIQASYEKDANEVYASINSNIDKQLTIASLIESGEAVSTKTTIKESDGDEITIPENFKVAKDSGETIEEGIVVISPDGSEFVWVPVPDVIYDGTTEIKVGTYTPMARLQSGTTNYQGVLYDLDKEQGSQTVLELSTNGVGTTNYREPSLVTGSDSDTYAEMETVTGTSYDASSSYYNTILGYDSAVAFGKDMQYEYDNMVESVNKYKGFYVGRYETGIENGKAVSKNAYKNETITTANVTQDTTKSWYGLYNKQRRMATDHSLTGVESNMIWGSQYDAMMNWMIKTGSIVGTGYDSSKYNEELVTGQSENDIINKVYDLYGCHWELTLEANRDMDRVHRGGLFNGVWSPSCRNASIPNETDYSTLGSRLTLYIEVNGINDDSTEEDTTIGVESITISGETTINVGETITLTETISPENATNKTVTWTSSDDTIATVDSTGKVTGVAAGTVTITAMAGGKSGTYTVTVEEQNNDDTQNTNTKYFNFTYDETNLTASITGIKDEYMPTVTLYKEDDSGELVEYSTDKQSLYIQDGENKLTELIIPSSVNYNGNEYSITNLAVNSFKAPDLDTYVLSEEELMFTKVVLPSSIKSISGMCFIDQNKIKEVELSENLETIYASAFADCRSLASVTYKGITYTDYNDLENALTGGRS